jgi:hypothetical protein
MAPVIIAPVDHCWFSNSLDALTTNDDSLADWWLFVDATIRGVADIELMGVPFPDDVREWWSGRCAASTIEAD